jgi:hypothetical protein
MDFEIGGYEKKEAFFLNSTGIFGLKIEPYQENKKQSACKKFCTCCQNRNGHQNIIIRIEKEHKQIIVNFESSTIAQNSQVDPLTLFALKNGTN